MNLVQALTGGKLVDPASSPPDPSRTPFVMTDFWLHRLDPEEADEAAEQAVREERAAAMNLAAFDKFGWEPLAEE